MKGVYYGKGQKPPKAVSTPPTFKVGDEVRDKLTGYHYDINAVLEGDFVQVAWRDHGLRHTLVMRTGSLEHVDPRD